MIKPVIEVKNLSKKYRISHLQKTNYRTIRDDIGALIKKPLSLVTGKTQEKEEFWALKDINFEVSQGDVVGIIGKNGSGKSTLLKILSRIVEPTKGEVVIRGKVASLLEVGTGFHPELTGRENILLNGAILGMKKREIQAKFDEIVAFSEVEKFLDTPVKFYSSGMYVRLAFAVAAHLEPEILIVDEVLAVGDAAFQKKSLSKMSSVAREGRTVLFVSHNVSAVQNLCSRAILLKEGSIQADGSTPVIVRKYAESIAASAEQPLKERKDRQGSGRVVFTGCQSLSSPRRTLKLRLSYLNMSGKSINDVKISVAIKDQRGETLANLTNTVLGQQIKLDEKEGDVYLNIEDVNLASGEYYLDLFLASDDQNSEIFDLVEGGARIEIDNRDFYSTKQQPPTSAIALFDFTYHQGKA
jgi:lipopolysaccharide transport system ATP-binding protein